MSRKSSILVLLLSCLFLLAAPAAAEPPLDNAGVVALVGLGLGDDVVLAKIRQAPAVAFVLGADDLKALKAQGVSSAVMTAMIDRSAKPTVVGTTSTASAEVTLLASDGEQILAPMSGTMRYENRMMAVVTYTDIEGMEAGPTTRDLTPRFRVLTASNPAGTYYIAYARPYPRKNVREIKSGTVSMMGAGSVSRPHDAWTVEYEAKQISPGVWELTPFTELGGGEFVLWKVPGSTPGIWLTQLFDFRIDGPAHPPF